MTGRRHAVLLASLAFAALLAACGGGPTPQPTETPEVIVPVPARPAAFEDYPRAVADYLSATGGPARGVPCLAELLDSWALPAPEHTPIATRDRCRTGNMDADSDDEVVVLFTAEPDDPGVSGLLSNVVVFDRTGGGYRVAYQSFVPEQFPQLTPQAIVAAEDINDDGAGELVYTSTWCGAHTCTLSVFALTGDGEQYAALTSPVEDRHAEIGSIAMETADVTLEDRDGDGEQEIVLHGGVIQSVGAGPQRTRTDIYAWNGSTYALTDTAFDESTLRYFKVVDADTAFAAGDYEEAVRGYREALERDNLEDVEYFGSREELLAYTTFRLGLSYLLLGDTAQASQHIEATIATYPASQIGRATVEFRNAIDLTQVGHNGGLAGGCAAATASLNGDPDRFQTAWNYGYANKGLGPADVCPF